jgi:hypothetical protein
MNNSASFDMVASQWAEVGVQIRAVAAKICGCWEPRAIPSVFEDACQQEMDCMELAPEGWACMLMRDLCHEVTPSTWNPQINHVAHKWVSLHRLPSEHDYKS